ncbi:maleylpyruvate isomerase N-terminal domain-containing protein [Streptomyces sp. NPDC096080]|uniref:maleylpyruvate isomerase N-terminal domain-containing protein n=1 Tax=Streptomyces sp. NPDC096080 TaxID=3156693 RepID=UPI00331ADFBC
MYWIDHYRLCAEIRRQSGHLTTALARLHPGTPVLDCPGWTAADLAAHLHAGFTWAAGLLTGGTTDFRPPHAFLGDVADEEVDPDAPWPAYVDTLTHAHAKSPVGIRIAEGGGEPLDRAAAALLDALESGGPDRPVWTCLGEQRARFWAAWGALEAGIHRLDAEAVLGAAPALDREVSEQLVGVLLALVAEPASAAFFDPQFTRLRTSGERILVRALDSGGGPGQWLLGLLPEGPALLEPGSARPHVTVEAPGELLLPLLKRRVPPTAPGIRVTGDGDVLLDYLAHVFS